MSRDSWFAIAASMWMAVGCGGESASGDGGTVGPDAGAMAQAEAAYWSAFLAGDVDGVAVARDGIVAALADDETDYVAQRYAGMAYILAIAEASNSANPPSPSDFSTYGQDALSHIGAAVAAAPPGQVIDVGHLADAQFFVGTVSGNGGLLQESETNFAATIDGYPIYGELSRAPPYVQLSLESPTFATGLESFFQVFEACTGTQLDRQNPDLSAVLGPLTDPECSNQPHHPHSFEGSLLLFGDALVKDGNPDAGLGVYERLTQAPGYPEWSYRSVVEQRLASDLEATAALYADAGASNGPPLGAATCLQCHKQ